jgi:hypothetical protein
VIARQAQAGGAAAGREHSHIQGQVGQLPTRSTHTSRGTCGQTHAPFRMRFMPSLLKSLSENLNNSPFPFFNCTRMFISCVQEHNGCEWWERWERWRWRWASVEIRWARGGRAWRWVRGRAVRIHPVSDHFDQHGGAEILCRKARHHEVLHHELAGAVHVGCRDLAPIALNRRRNVQATKEEHEVVR